MINSAVETIAIIAEMMKPGLRELTRGRVHFYQEDGKILFPNYLGSATGWARLILWSHTGAKFVDFAMYEFITADNFQDMVAERIVKAAIELEEAVP